MQPHIGKVPLADLVAEHEGLNLKCKARFDVAAVHRLVAFIKAHNIQLICKEIELLGLNPNVSLPADRKDSSPILQAFDIGAKLRIRRTSTGTARIWDGELAGRSNECMKRVCWCMKPISVQYILSAPRKNIADQHSKRHQDTEGHVDEIVYLSLCPRFIMVVVKDTIPLLQSTYSGGRPYHATFYEGVLDSLAGVNTGHGVCQSL